LIRSQAIEEKEEHDSGVADHHHYRHTHTHMPTLSSSSSGASILVLLLAALLIAVSPSGCRADPSLSPADWPPDVFAAFQTYDAEVGPHPPGVSPNGNVSSSILHLPSLTASLFLGINEGLGALAGTSNAFAIHAGQVALASGGSAIDAAITTALTQVVLNAGGYVSFGGIATIGTSDPFPRCWVSF